MPPSIHEAIASPWQVERGGPAAGSRQPVWRLIAVQKDVHPAQLSLIGPSWTLGRAKDNAIVVAREAVSRRHALIVRESDDFRLSDLGSRNGTFINGVRFRGSELLVHRDLIGLGEAEPCLRFIDDHAFADPVPGMPAARSHHTRLRFDERQLRFLLYDRPLDLTEDEFRLLHRLYASAGSVCTREECAVAVWGADAHRHEQILDRLADGLRRKLRHLDPEIDLAQTRITGGFILTI